MKIIGLLIKSSALRFFIAAIGSVISGLAFTNVVRLLNAAIIEKAEHPEELIMPFVYTLLIYTVTSLIAAYLITDLSQIVIKDMRLGISNKILQASFHKLEYETKRLFTILTDDINTISNIIIKLPAIISAMAIVLGCFGYMIYISPQLFLLFFGVFIVAFILYRLPLNSYAERLRKTRNHQNILFGYFEGLIYGLKELTINKTFRGLYTKEIIEPLTEEQRKHQVIGKTIVEIFSRWGEVIVLFGIGAIFFIVRTTAFTNEAVMLSFLSVTLFAINPLSRITRVLPDFQRINIALEQIQSAGLSLEEDAVEKNKKDHTFTPKAEQSIISLQEVKYSYYHNEEEKFFQLGPVNLEVKKGQVTFLIGGNGSGKSTLAKVLCGLYPPQEGMVKYNGEEINETNIEEFRDQFSVIFADFYLFNEIIHIPQTVIDEKAQEYLKLLELDKKVQIVDRKLTTTNLSTGQRKRLALLVSYLEDKPIYLFDEWAAGLDPYYKKIFYKKLIPDLKAKGKTVFAITHDESYFDCADEVIMLKDGQLLENHLLHDQLKEFFN